jgi:hypothetical protein
MSPATIAGIGITYYIVVVRYGRVTSTSTAYL